MDKTTVVITDTKGTIYYSALLLLNYQHFIALRNHKTNQPTSLTTP